MSNMNGEFSNLNGLFHNVSNSRLTPTAAVFIPRSYNLESRHNQFSGIGVGSVHGENYGDPGFQPWFGSNITFDVDSLNNQHRDSQFENVYHSNLAESVNYSANSRILENNLLQNYSVQTPCIDVNPNDNFYGFHPQYYTPRNCSATSRPIVNTSSQFGNDAHETWEKMAENNYCWGSDYNEVTHDDNGNNRYNAGVCIPSSVFENAKYKSNTQFISGSGSSSCMSTKLNIITVEEKPSGASVCQRDDLMEQLRNATLECLVCCDRIHQREPTWSCSNCYHVLHFWCIVRWAKSSQDENTASWRCPACQNANTVIPAKYVCFCDKNILRTEWNKVDVPHSCGEICTRFKHKNSTTCCHRCTLLCHPGPCPPCVVQVTRKCGCGKTNQFVQCGSSLNVVCGNICNKLLNCGVHYCAANCHVGECKSCEDTVTNNCYCGRTKKKEICRAGISEHDRFSCGLPCDRTLDCGNHKCQDICHEGLCKVCDKMPTAVTACPCGKTKSNDYVRLSCLEPFPLCSNVCGKLLPCGSPQKPHFCEMTCHEGDCRPCSKQTTIRCRCGSNSKTVPCLDLCRSVSDFHCKKKCNRKRKCGKHKCNQACCIDLEHNCLLRCSGMLTCGRHRCDLLCHPGKCVTCPQTSFDDLFCHCGKTVMHAPIPCGTRPPICDFPCVRIRSCKHPTFHNCHSSGDCPPCTVFTDKFCYGGHELRRTIPCYQKEFSCGLPCGKQLPCGLHTCTKPCHDGDCLLSGEKCSKPCIKPRSLCGHPCNVPCHPQRSVCPNTPCRKMIKITCQCENRVELHPCSEHTKDFENIVSSTLAPQMAQLQLSGVVNTADATEKIAEKRRLLKIFECNEECSIIMRNRRLALCLQIQNPNLSPKIIPQYSDFMKQWAKRDPALCQHVHEKLSSLVQLAKESKQKSRSYSFEVMNKDKRQFVHEYCAHFGCESQAYDAEPKRNVVAIAVKDKCWLPSYSLMQVVQKEMGYRKIHLPAFANRKHGSNSGVHSEELSSNMVIMPIARNNSSS